MFFLASISQIAVMQDFNEKQLPEATCGLTDNVLFSKCL